MKVHDLFVALSQCDRGANVTIKDGKIRVGGKVLKVAAEVESEDEESKPADDEKPEGDEP